MTRLIDADALREDWLQNGENEYVYDANAFIESIDCAPTVGAVEVIRCKDCLWEKTNLFAKELGIVYCSNYGKRKKQDDFCSEGEHKGDSI